MPEEYYRQLRGLNKSFLAHLTSQVEKDEFCDISVGLDKYRSYRADIVAKHSKPAAGSAGTPMQAAPAVAPKPSPFQLGGSDTKPSPFQLGGSDTATAAAAKPAPFQFQLPTTFKLPTDAATQPALGFSGAAVPASGTGLLGAPKFPAFGVALPAASASVAAGDEDGGEGDDDGNEPIPAEEPTRADQFKKGAGEEDEDTLFEVEGVKLFRKDGDGAWEKLGVGLLRINENRTTHKRRLLSRSEGVGQVLLNTAMFAGMRAVVVSGSKSPSVDILCVFPGSRFAHVLVRLAADTDAANLAEAIDKFRPST